MWPINLPKNYATTFVKSLIITGPYYYGWGYLSKLWKIANNSYQQQNITIFLIANSKQIANDFIKVQILFVGLWYGAILVMVQGLYFTKMPKALNNYKQK